MVKKRSPTWYRKKCVAWAKDAAKTRDNYTCQHCGKTRDSGWAIHGSHILPEGAYVSMSADVDNIIALCATCHIGGFNRGGSRVKSWHGDPMYFAEWFNKRWPGRYQELHTRAQTMTVVNWEQRWASIKNDLPHKS